MTNKIKVYGEEHNRIALGILKAYMVIYPQSTLDDLRREFPNDLNPDAKEKGVFCYKEDLSTDNNSEFFFSGENELICTGDVQKVAFTKLWSSKSFETIEAYAVQYGIVVELSTVSETEGYRLEYLNGYEPPVFGGNNKSKWWLWLLLVIVAGVLGFYGAKAFLKPIIQEVEVEKEVLKIDTVNITRVDTVNITRVDTVFMQQVENIQKEFNAAKFTKGKADLSDVAKEPLFKLADVLRKHENLNLRIVGHTSAEGTEKFNRTLSEARAKAAYDFLVARGIAAERMQYEGKGASELLNTENPKAEENRRTEFIIEENENIDNK